MRDAAGDCFVQVGLQYGVLATTDDYLRAAHDAVLAGGDCCVLRGEHAGDRTAGCRGCPDRRARRPDPEPAHLDGRVPRRSARHVDSAAEVYRQVKALERAGAFAAEIEVVPEAIANEIAERTSLVLFSMGAGAGCDAQYLFAEDILGYTRGHRRDTPRCTATSGASTNDSSASAPAHSPSSSADVDSGAYPQPEHLVDVDDAVVEQFVRYLDERAGDA